MIDMGQPLKKAVGMKNGEFLGPVPRRLEKHTCFLRGFGKALRPAGHSAGGWDGCPLKGRQQRISEKHWYLAVFIEELAHEAENIFHISLRIRGA